MSKTLQNKKQRPDPIERIAAYGSAWMERRSNPKDPRFRLPGDKAGAYLDRCIYSLSKHLLRHPDKFEVFRAHCCRMGWAPSPEQQSNPFAWVAVTLYGSQAPITKVHRNHIRLIARKLQYAYDAGIPTRFLVGWLYEAGGSKEIERLHAIENGTQSTSGSHSVSTKVKRRPKRRLFHGSGRGQRGRGSRIGKRFG